MSDERSYPQTTDPPSRTRTEMIEPASRTGAERTTDPPSRTRTEDVRTNPAEAPPRATYAPGDVPDTEAQRVPVTGAHGVPVSGTEARETRGRMAIPRSRGAVSGAVPFILGIWGAIIPFVGPYFHYAFINDRGFSWPTTGRLWLDIIPGVVAALAGLELMRSANRPSASIAAMCAAAAGAWFIVGPTVSTVWNHGRPQTGQPLGGTFLRMIEWLGYFHALGAVILFFAALALGRLSVRSVRDVRASG